eukprot:scaffold4393_cov183-Ochromonas_danica.AAC.7
MSALVLFLTWLAFYESYSFIYNGFKTNRNRALTLKEKSKANNNIDKYLHVKELIRLQKQGANYEELKAFSVNGTESKKKQAAYQHLLGKGRSLDQRLRAIVAYKRSTNSMERSTSFVESTAMSRKEEEMLEKVVDEEGEDQGEAEDGEDEEAIFQNAVLQAMERAKLEEVRLNLDLANISYVSAPIPPAASDDKRNEKSEKEEEEDEDDMYVPAVPTWGVYRRPRRGGGRVLSQEDMNQLGREMEAQAQLREQESNRQLATMTQLENEHKDAIENAIKRARGLMSVGSCDQAVNVLENVRPYLFPHSELGSSALLELAMAFETVCRLDEARQLYSLLATKSWSSGTRRQAIGLLSGLDISRSIRKDGQVSKYINQSIDQSHLVSISLTLHSGLYNSWDHYDLQRAGEVSPWMDSGQPDLNVKESKIVRTIGEAYRILLTETHPLRTVPSNMLAKSCRKFFLTPLTERLSFISQQKDSSVWGKDFEKPADMWIAVNGTWDLVASVLDMPPYPAKRFDSGNVRRSLLVANKQCVETNSIFWGMGTMRHDVKMQFVEGYLEITLIGEDLRRSTAPWQKQKQAQQSFQVNILMLQNLLYVVLSNLRYVGDD